jgi:translation initiation factor 2 beta subunit (eIF-2beta)/eIF-5
MAIITSESDWATKYAFPAGRLYTWAQAARQDGERATVLNTVGHLSRYITHRLKYQPPTETTTIKRENLSETTIEQGNKTISDLSRGPKKIEVPSDHSYGGITVTSEHKDLDSHFPYLVMSADSTIINGHNDIWNDVFAQFMVSFLTEEVMETNRDNEKVGINQEPQPEDGNRPECTPFWREPALR